MRRPRQIFVLAEQSDLGLRTRKSEPLGDRGGKQRTRVIVAADHGGDLDALDFGEDGLDLVEWIGGEVVATGGVADQVFQTGARIVVEEIFGAGRGEVGQFAIVAMGRADDEDGAVRPRRLPAWLLPTVDVFHGASFALTSRAGGSIGQARQAWIDRGLR